MTGAAVTCVAVALTTGRPCGRRVAAGQTTCRWHREQRDDLALADEMERRHDHREELRRARRARNRAEQPTVRAEPAVPTAMAPPPAGHSAPELVVRSGPASQDEPAGLVLCPRCLERVSPQEAAEHRLGTRPGVLRAMGEQDFADEDRQQRWAGTFDVMRAQW